MRILIADGVVDDGDIGHHAKPRRLPGTKVILYTMHDTKGIVTLAREAGVWSCVAKSGSADELVSAIERASRLPRLCRGRARRAGGRVGSSSVAAAPTARQYQLVRLIADGKRNAEAAEILGISVRTVETHRSNLMR